MAKKRTDPCNMSLCVALVCVLLLMIVVWCMRLDELKKASELKWSKTTYETRDIYSFYVASEDEDEFTIAEKDGYYYVMQQKEDATYTKMSYNKSNTEIVSVVGDTAYDATEYVDTYEYTLKESVK